MSTRLTYTSGALGSEADEEVEARLAQARAADGGEALPHVVSDGHVAGGQPFSRVDPCNYLAQFMREQSRTVVG